MSSRWWYTVLVALAVALLGAGESWGKDKPGGGGGGGGGGDPPPDGVIYFDGGSILPDGSGEQAVPGTTLDGNIAHPSYALHGGKRWFLNTVFDGAANPDGPPSSRVVAVREDGSQVVTLLPSSTGWRVDGAGWPLVWGKDDSFLSFTAVAWYGSGALDANSCVFRADVEWDSAGAPSVAGGLDVIVELTELQNESVARSVIHQCDWEPGGNRLVYHYGPAGVNDLRLFSLGSGDDVFLASGHDPRWAPDGSLIAYARAPAGSSGVWTLDPDTSGSETVFLADGGKWRYHTPRWSPDSTHLCFSKVSRSSVRIARASLAGGSQATVRAGAQPIGWRDS